MRCALLCWDASHTLPRISCSPCAERVASFKIVQRGSEDEPEGSLGMSREAGLQTAALPKILKFLCSMGRSEVSRRPVFMSVFAVQAA